MSALAGRFSPSFLRFSIGKGRNCPFSRAFYSETKGKPLSCVQQRRSVGNGAAGHLDLAWLHLRPAAMGVPHCSIASELFPTRKCRICPSFLHFLYKTPEIMLQLGDR